MSPGAGPSSASACQEAYVRRETAISVAINATLSLVFFALVIGFRSRVPVVGLGGYAIDFIPQSFAIALMSVLVPGASRALRVRRGQLVGIAETPGRIAARAVLSALFAGLLGCAVAGVLLASFGSNSLPLLPAIVVKVVYGAVLAALVTPVGLRRALRPYQPI